MKIKSFILAIIMLLSCQITVFADEVKIPDIIEQPEITHEVELSYLEVIEGIVKTLNKRDSYYFEIVNPENTVQYLTELGIELRKNLYTEVTRAEFAQLVTLITEKITREKHYSTDLIDITDIFYDISNLNEETQKAIETVFLEGLIGGVDEHTFAPNDILTKKQFNIIMSRLEKGYNRSKLYKYIDSVFTYEDRIQILEKYNYFEDTTLTTNDLNFLLTQMNDSIVVEKEAESSVVIKDVINIMNLLWPTPGSLFRPLNNNDSYYYLAQDTTFLSAEEWDYLRYNLDKELMLSEFLILYDRVIEMKVDMLNLGLFDSWDKIINYSNKYLGFIMPLIENNKDCFTYFLGFNDANFKTYPYLFARAVHECQHEEFLTLSNTKFTRFKGTSYFSTWGIHCEINPEYFHYYDYTNGIWADSYMDFEMPVTGDLYEHYPEYMKEDVTIKNYAYDPDISANTLGIYGLLSEFCSFSLETKVQAVSYSLGMNNAEIYSLDYDSYRKMELLMKDYLKYLEYSNLELYQKFVSDTDTMRVINNILKDMDIVENLYAEDMKEETDEKLLNWENEINNGYFKTEEAPGSV